MIDNASTRESRRNIALATGIVIAIICALAVCVFGAVFLFFPSEPNTVDEYLQDYGGNVNVYNRITTLDDCAALQAEFDIASENNLLHEPGSPESKETTGYMTAANNRMEEIGCYSE
jgi:hypothetical protein